MFDFNFLQPYLNFIPQVFIAFAITLLITPAIGFLAKKYGFVDLPVSQRPRESKNLEQKIHNRILPRLGGLAVMLTFIVVAFSSSQMTTQLWGVFLGILILIVTGLIDDKYELDSKTQFFFQILVATITVIFGVSITYIEIFGLKLDLSIFTHEFLIGNHIYNFVFPADLFTVFWIITLINALNWVFGIDDLGEGITIITAITIMFIAIKTGHPEIAILPAILFGSLLGYFPYNYPPSKIISGTIGATSYGYLIAVLSILSGAKISTAVLLLTLPLLDMLWVIIYRLIHLKDVPFLKRPFKGGRVHLHHRLMNVGYTMKETLVIETAIMAVIAVIAYYTAGFGVKLLTSSIIVAIITIISSITVISSRKKRVKERLARINKGKEEPPTPPIETDIPPEERYAY